MYRGCWGKFLSFSFIILVLNSWGINAQPKDFGKVDVSEFSNYSADFDSMTSAVVLFDKGEVTFDANYLCFLEVHRRVLILFDEGAEYGEVEIPLFKDADQSVSGIKAATYTLLPDGKIETKKLGRKEVYTTEYDKDITLKKFTLPNIQPGVIIEYKYKKRMGNPFYLPDWQFHDFIPVQWSEFNMYIPVDLRYQLIFKGSDPLHIKEIDQGTYYRMESMRYHLVKKDLPAVEDLPFLINREDHLSAVKTQLVGIMRNGIMQKTFFKDWKDVAKEINDFTGFGKQRLDGSMKDKVDELLVGATTDLEKMERLYEYVIEYFEWDGKHRVISDQGIRDTFEKKTGNTADINIMLMEMLRYAGLKASPTLISTRANGNVLTEFALVNQFNMVVTAVEMEDGAVILDASSGKRGYRTPHPKILYRQAFVVREDDSFGWITTMPLDIATEKTGMEISFTDSNSLVLNMSGVAEALFAEMYREEVDSTDQKEYWEDELEEFENVEVMSSFFSNLDKLGEEVRYSAIFTIDGGTDLMKQGNLIYINPFLFLKRERNPFIKNERDFPVEFSFPYQDTKMITIYIPEGYEVEEIPETGQMRLPNDGGWYRFVTKTYDDKITIVSSYNLSSVYFHQNDYQTVKDFYQMMVDTQTAMVVLKKTVAEGEAGSE